MEKVIGASRLIGMQLDPSEGNPPLIPLLHQDLRALPIATAIIVKQACVVLNAERATLFTYVRSIYWIAPRG